MGLDMYLEAVNGDQRVEVGYWRKDNAIHNWFVKNCANGVDECQPTPVKREDLKNLKTLCESVLSNPELAEDSLPTRSGFFFGSTSYDEYYMKGLKETVEIIDKALASDYAEFIYQASW